MKFRRLKLEELEAAEKEFIAFLAVNGISADLWEEIKSDPAQSDQWIDQFSDVYFQSQLEGVEYVDVRLDDELFCFHFQPSIVQLAHLTLSKSVDWDNSKSLSSIPDLLLNGEGSIQVQSKSYNPDRESEIFKMLEKGGSISNGSWFKALVLAFAQNN